MRSTAQRVKLVAVACLAAAGGCSGGDDDGEADGIVTGPLHDELFPSKWCKKFNCSPAANK